MTRTHALAQVHVHALMHSCNNSTRCQWRKCAQEARGHACATRTTQSCTCAAAKSSPAPSGKVSEVLPSRATESEELCSASCSCPGCGRDARRSPSDILSPLRNGQKLRSFIIRSPAAATGKIFAINCVLIFFSTNYENGNCIKLTREKLVSKESFHKKNIHQ